MEQGISKFLDGMPAVELKRYEQLHRHLARLPVPDSKKSCQRATLTTPRVNPRSLGGIYQYIPVHTSMYQYVLVCTDTG